MEENIDFLTTQIITYLGNKRSLIGNIEKEIEKISKAIGREKLVCADLFSGSGIVARMLKSHSSMLIVNDQEDYSSVINSCYLINKKDFPKEKYDRLRSRIERKGQKEKIPGIITENYAPKNDENIMLGERVFYTHENAVLIDTYRNLIDKIVREDDLKKFFLAPLITEASIHWMFWCIREKCADKNFWKDRAERTCVQQF